MAVAITLTLIGAATGGLALSMPARFPAQTLRASHPRTAQALMLDGGAAAAALKEAQAQILTKIAVTLDLESKAYPQEVGFDSFTMGSFSGTVKAFDAPGKTNVAWCSGLEISDGQSRSMSRITAWCGPLTDVPHFVASAGVSNGGLDLYIDFRPRADAGYEKANPDGTYPEPDTREAFMQSGVRMEFAEKFFTPDAVAWFQSVCNTPGASPSNEGLPAEAAVLQGPLTVNLRLPLDSVGVSAASEACANAADRWIQWMQTTEELNRLKVTSTYARDTKMRAVLFSADADELTAKFGAEGRELAAADAGPLDEAYVGGAS